MMPPVIPRADPPSTKPDKEAETREGFAAFLRQEYQRRLEERRAFEQEWVINLAFIEGNQHAVIHPVTGELYVPDKAFPWEQRDVFNQLAAIHETRIAKLTRNRPVMSVRPGSPDEEDVNASKVASRLLRYNMDEQGFMALQSEAIAWSESCGTAFLKNLWNADRGDKLPDPGGEGLEVPIGDIESVVVSPFEILPDNVLRPRLEEQGSIIHAKAWPIESEHVKRLVEAYHALTGETMKPSGEDVHAVTLGRGSMAINGMPTLKFATKTLTNHCIVLEYYERPTKDHPRGRFAIMIGHQLVHYGDLPYDDLDLPFVKIDSIRRPNCFWAKSIVTRLVPVQRRYNVLRNRVAEYLNRVGIGQWTVEEGTVDIEDITNEPGLVVQHTRGSRPPSPVQFPSLPATFMQEIDQLQSELMSISGVHEVSHGQLPKGSGGAPSGILVQSLQEQDDTRIAVAQRQLDEAVEKTGTQWLRRYKQYAVEQRTFPIMGRNKQMQRQAFDQTVIRSYNVKVEASNALASTPGARRDMVFAMIDRGLFNDPETGRLSPHGLQKVFEMLEFGNWEDFEEDKALPQSRAQWENQLFSMGQNVPVWPWEDHLMHVQIHRRYQQSEEFYQLLERGGMGVAQMLEMHVQQHVGHLTGAAPQGAPPGQPAGPMDPSQQGPPMQGPPMEGPPMGPPPMQMPPAQGMPTPQQAPSAPPTGQPSQGDPMERVLVIARQIEKQSGPDKAAAFVRDALKRLTPKER